MKVNAKMIKVPSGFALAFFLAFMLFGAKAYAVTIDFDSVDASRVYVPAATYLAGYGITLSDVTPGSTVVIIDDRNLYAEGSTTAASPHNMLSQWYVNAPVHYTMNFAATVDTFSMTRIAVNTPSSFPWWRAHAYNARGTELSMVGEDNWGGTRSAQIFTLTGPDIKSVLVEADGYGFCAFPSALLDNFSPAPVPVPGTLLLLGSGLLGLAGLRRFRKE